ncbi:hypothetical protein AB9B48_22985 [Kluyvera ascorbata]|uniref:hypothetical protein n=1 Tax=Kluyvera ascorbata TaxID=51288 RepID=UPI0029406E04|nr:hypothetical protein [Kluyvera ascorbata]HED1308676.1 hypothetical protein [Kluyvera ascorbata]
MCLWFGSVPFPAALRLAGLLSSSWCKQDDPGAAVHVDETATLKYEDLSSGCFADRCVGNGSRSVLI